jgi:hypothetical protein
METTLKHRKAAIELLLVNGAVDATATPLANQEVKISQISNQFLFGCGGFDAVELAGGKPDDGETGKERAAFLSEKLGKLFTGGFNNYATLPFYIGRYEPVEGKPDEARVKAGAKWFIERGIKLKGHPL